MEFGFPNILKFENRNLHEFLNKPIQACLFLYEFLPHDYSNDF